MVGLLSKDGSVVELRGLDSTSPTARLPVALAHNRYPDSQWVQASSTDEAITRLSEASQKCQSLDFTLILFDGGLSCETRKAAAEELDDLLAIEANRNYVLDIVLSKPLHKLADCSGAISVANTCSRAKEFVQEIVNAQAQASRLFNAWLTLRSHSLVRVEQLDEINVALINYGIYRRLAIDGKTQADVEALAGSLVTQQGLTRVCNARILRDFISEYKSTLLPGSRSGTNVAACVSEGDDNEGRSNQGSRIAARVGSADDLAEWASRQVDAAAEHFRNERDDLGRRFWKELVDAQTRDGGTHRHVVKSLCNLSNQCSAMGRTELAMEVLTEAFGFENGIDAVAYVQLGDEFYRLGQHEKASSCYRKAEGLESDFERSQQIRRKLIRTVSASGRYDEAIAAHLATPDFDKRSDVLTDLGTLKRKLGALQPARDYFWRAIKLDSTRYQAYAGLAEAKRQSGRIHEALEAYNLILKPDNFQGMDVGANKVYRLAQCSLYRLTHQFDRSRSELHKLYKTFKHDVEVKSQYGRLLILMGDRLQGEQMLSEIDMSRSLSIADELYAIAMKINFSGSDSTFGAGGKRINDYLPEDRGLASCKKAMDAILNDEFEDAWQLVSSATFVDRLHRDFGLVLGYHAKKRIDPQFRFKSSQPLARLAKRGFRELKRSVIAISEERFDDAINHERAMCLLLA